MIIKIEVTAQQIKAFEFMENDIKKEIEHFIEERVDAAKDIYRHQNKRIVTFE